MAADVRRRVDAGQSDAEIRAAFVRRYGEPILLTPSGGSAALAWGVPLLLILGATVGVVLAVRRWVRRDAGDRTATEADDRLVREIRTRIATGGKP
jgi:cytochrome c-type biogenesis protein CcmH/NrfF